MQALLLKLTGLESRDLKPALWSFASLFFLLLSYYLVKPMRDSRFFLHFSADQLPYFYLISPVAALVVTKTFNAFVEKIPPRRLMIITYGIMMVCKGVFVVLMQFSQPWSTAVFYVWASVYFSLVLAILWATINSAFGSEQAERCFGVITIGATLGGIFGAKVSGLLAKSVIKDWTLLLSVVSMACALGFVLRLRPTQQQTPDTQKEVPESGFWDDVKTLIQRPYMRGIAFMVFALALASTVVNLQVYKQIDNTLARASYVREFQSWDASAQHFDTIRELKGKKEAETNAALKQLSLLTPAQGDAITAEALATHYANYQDHLEGETRSLFANVYFWQGILGVFLLGVVARLLFKFVGLRWSAILLPGFFFVVLMALFFPLETLALQVILVFSGALNYSLNNATKELLYTPTSTQARYQHKPLIEGPVMRLGDVSASLLKIGVTTGFSGLVVWSQVIQSQILLGVGLAATAVWIALIWYTGQQYDHNQKQTTQSQELDLA